MAKQAVSLHCNPTHTTMPDEALLPVFNANMPYKVTPEGYLPCKTFLTSPDWPVKPPLHLFAINHPDANLSPENKPPTEDWLIDEEHNHANADERTGNPQAYG